MGVTFFGDEAPDDFGTYNLAFVTVFSITAGNSWVRCPKSESLIRVSYPSRLSESPRRPRHRLLHHRRQLLGRTVAQLQ